MGEGEMGEGGERKGGWGGEEERGCGRLSAGRVLFRIYKFNVCFFFKFKLFSKRRSFFFYFLNLFDMFRHV